MSSWNYRLIGDGCRFWVGEVYYDDDGAMTGCTGGGVLDDWDALDELVDTMGRVSEALARPLVVLDLDGSLTEDPDTVIGQPTISAREAVE